VPGGGGLLHLAAVLPDPVRRGGAAPNDVDEAGPTGAGSTAVDGLNRALLAKAVEAKVARTNKVRADTTVVPANVAYPTDSGLLAKAVRRIGVSVKRIHAAGGAVRTQVRDRSRTAGAKAHGVAAKLRSRAQLGRDDAKAGVQRITGELADLAESAIKDARKLLVNARRAANRAQAKATVQAASGCPRCGRRAATRTAGSRGQRPAEPGGCDRGDHWASPEPSGHRRRRRRAQRREHVPPRRPQGLRRRLIHPGQPRHQHEMHPDRLQPGTPPPQPAPDRAGRNPSHTAIRR